MLAAATRDRTRISPVRGRTDLLALALLVVGLGAVVLRLSMLIRSNWLLEGDDALSALMALGVLDGDRPIMLKNQTYAAAWEPYAMALSYLVLGVSRVAAKAPALVGSLALIATTWLLAREVAGKAAAWFAALLFAVPPVYVLVLTLKPWAPYTEVMLLGGVCLTCGVRLAWPRRFQNDAAWALGCGLCAGLALWMHPLAIWYVAAASVLVLARVRGRRWPRILAGGVLGLLVGGLPIWIYNLQTGGATFRFIFSGSQGQTADRGAVLGAWWNNDLPRGAGFWHPWGPSPAFLGVLMIVWVFGACAWAVLGRRQLRLRPLDAMVVLLVLIPLVLVLSGFGGPALNPYGFDATGRYTPPIWNGLAVVLGAALGAVWQRVNRGLAVLLGVVPVAVNLAGALAIDPLAAFQSPYWDRLPGDNAALLSALRAEQVQDVWMNHWAGQPAMFDARAAGQALFAYDWYDVQAGGIDRFPEYRRLVEQSARPAFVLVTDEAQPELERDLRAMGVSFVERRAPPYVVVIPTSRKVHPSEVTAAVDYRY
jgi:Dolichyl-phosphate-mannose-protein mannosyltransferase